MKKNRLNNDIASRLKSVAQDLSFYCKDKQPERLHCMRVDLKKIKALCYFGDKVYQEKYSSKRLKPLFDKAGNIRVLQINTLLLCQFPQPPESIIERLKKDEITLRLNFLRNTKRYLSLVKKFKKEVQLPKTLPNKNTIVRFFKEEKKKAAHKLKDTDRLNVHMYRTKIKRMMYVYDALPQKTRKAVGLNVQQINKLQNQLGNWHDTYTAVNFLSKEHFPVNSTEYILKLKEKEKIQFRALFKS